MKARPKIKTKSKKTKKRPSLICSELFRFKLVEHKYTGKLIHRRHTLHVALVGILLFVGFFLYASKGLVQAQEIVSNGTVSVNVIVHGPAPAIGATITSPIDGTSVVDNNIIEVKGTCLKDTFVIVRDSNGIVGSTVCTSAGTFALQVQLRLGKNVLSALNYDNLNQPGPDTPIVTIYLTKSSGEVEIPTPVVSEPVVPEPTIPAPTLPTNPSIIPDVESDLADCSEYKDKTDEFPVGGDPHVAVVCVPRLFQPKLEQVLGVLVWGGKPPYAINVDWGDGSEATLLSLPTSGYKKETFSYKNAGVYSIKFKLKDSDGKTAVVETAVQVIGEAKTPFAAFADDILKTSWFKTPVPLYVMAVAITLGFWVGDIFDRNFGAGKHRQRYRRST